MIYSSERNRSSKASTSARGTGNAVLALSAAFFAVVAISVFFAFGGRLPSLGNTYDVSIDDVRQLWDEQQFEEIIAVTDQILGAEPLDPDALVFHGLANYFFSLELDDGEEKSDHLEQGISSLRRARVLPNTPHRTEVEYVLGLAYYSRNEYYVDLAVEHLENAVDRGLSTATVHEYLGLAYRELGDLESSIEHFNSAVDVASRNVTHKALAETYYETGRLDSAREHLDRVIAGSAEPQLVHEARILMGRIHLEEGRFEDAHRQFNVVLEENPNSADAQFYLGEYYHMQDESVRARAYWRNAVNIDSGHLEALRRLES